MDIEQTIKDYIADHEKRFHGEGNIPKKSKKKDIALVFDCWNSYKGKGKWKSHRELTYETEMAIKEQLKHYSSEQLCKAIHNYAKILIGKEYRWSYAWTMYQFLTRGKPENNKEKQLWRFLDNNFEESDFLTDVAVKKRVVIQREKNITPPKRIATIEERKAIFDKLGSQSFKRDLTMKRVIDNNG